MGDKTALGMIGCTILGDEMAYVLESDATLENVVIVDNKEGRRFREKLDPTASGLYVQFVGETELGKVELSGRTVVVWVKGASLHDDPKNLLNNIATTIRLMEACCGAVQIFYGMCRSTKYDIKRFVDSFTLPVMFLTDAEGNVVDDCFAAVLGGRRRYQNLIQRCKGTMFLTTGYAEYLEGKQEGKGLETLVQEFESYQLLFKTLGYDKAMILDTGLGDREGLRERAHYFTAMFDMTLETTRCELAVFEQSYRQAWAMVPSVPSSRGVEEEMVVTRTLP